jgi:hypothetical protein
VRRRRPQARRQDRLRELSLSAGLGRWAGPLARACAWVDAHLASFEVERSASALLPSIKAVAELAHAGDYLARTDDPTWSAIGRRWLDFAWGQTAEGELVRAVIATDPRFVPIAITYLPFHLSGRRNDALCATVRAQVGQMKMVPLGWAMTVPALRMLGIEPTAAMEEQGRLISVLADRTPPARLPQDAVYLLTHECAYATSWGRHDPGWDPDTRAYAAAALRDLLGLHRDDADVTAELVLAVHAVVPDCVPADAWRTLERAQQAAGNVAPPEQLVTIFERHSHPVLTRTYHTTLVAIMAWASCAHPSP